MTISRMLAAMLATAALIVPTTAAATPMDPIVDMHQSTAVAAAREHAKQDLRSPDRRDPAAPQLRRAQPPTWPAHPQPLTPPAKTVAAKSDDGGIAWATIGIGVGLSVIAVTALGALSLRLRRRERVAT
jgi:hypothetical protein